MKDRVHITPIQLHNINIIRIFRFDLSISAREISYALGKSPSYVATIESENSIAYYSDDIMTEIAIFLTAEAKKLQMENKENGIKKKIKTEYTILDFYPKKPLVDIKVLKSIEPVPKGSGAVVTLNAVIEDTDFFDETRTLAQIVTHCNQLQNQHWTGSDFTQTLDRLVKKGRLKVETLTGGIYGYYNPKEKN